MCQPPGYFGVVLGGGVGWGSASPLHRKWRRWLLLAKPRPASGPLPPIVGDQWRALPIVGPLFHQPPANLQGGKAHTGRSTSKAPPSLQEASRQGSDGKPRENGIERQI